MKLLVIGASQGTGALCVKAGLARGHSVTAFARTPGKLTLDDPKLTRVAGSFHDAALVAPAVAGQDAVIITASSLSGMKAKPDYFSDGTRVVMEAMKSHGVKRLVVLSALGVGESRARMNFVMRALLIDGFLKAAYSDHEVQERLVRASGLDWVIAQPPRLTDGPARGAYVTTTTGAKIPMSLSRADLADFLVKACEGPEFVKHTVLLGG